MVNKLIGKLYGFLTSWFKSLNQFCFNAYIKNVLEQLGENPNIHHSVEFRFPQNISIGDDVTIKKQAILSGRTHASEFGIMMGKESYIKENCYLDSYGGYIKIGDYSAISQFSMIAGHGGVEIGKYVMIGGHTYIISSNHIFKSNQFPYMAQGSTSKKVVIEDNVWIGGNSIILNGITIGKNSVVGAGSIVTKDIPPDSIYSNGRFEEKLKKIIHEEDILNQTFGIFEKHSEEI